MEQQKDFDTRNEDTAARSVIVQAFEVPEEYNKLLDEKHSKSKTFLKVFNQHHFWRLTLLLIPLAVILWLIYGVIDAYNNQNQWWALSLFIQTPLYIGLGAICYMIVRWSNDKISSRYIYGAIVISLIIVGIPLVNSTLHKRENYKYRYNNFIQSMNALDYDIYLPTDSRYSDIEYIRTLFYHPKLPLVYSEYATKTNINRIHIQHVRYWDAKSPCRGTLEGSKYYRYTDDISRATCKKMYTTPKGIDVYRLAILGEQDVYIMNINNSSINFTLPETVSRPQIDRTSPNSLTVPDDLKSYIDSFEKNDAKKILFTIDPDHGLTAKIE